MRSLARYILSGPFQAVTVVFFFALLSFVFPFLIIFSGGALALITLKVGARHAIRILLICVALVALSTWLLLGNLTAGPLIVWISIVAVAYMYQHFQSLSIALQALTIFGALLTLLIAVLFPDLQAEWLLYLTNLLEAIKQGPSFQIMMQSANLSLEQAEQYLPGIASLMTGMVVAVYLLTVSVTSSFGGWWNDLLDDAQAFHKEFVRFNLGRTLAIAAALFAVVAFSAKAAVFWQLTIVCLSMFFLQGLGLAHAVIGAFSKPLLGFVTVYGLLFIVTPQMMLVLASAGVLDGFVDFRKRFMKSDRDMDNRL